MRTHFSHYKDNFVQEIEESAVFKVGYQETNEVEIKELMEDFIQPFDLEKLPLMRMKIIRNTQNGECFLLFDIHHIICDGESVGIFFSELDKIYRGAKLPELKFQYKNFSAWEQKQTFQEQEEYWLNEFSGDLNCLELRTDYVRPAWQSFKGHSLEFSVERDTVERIRTFCSQMHVTEFMLFMSVFSILLQKYTGQEDIVIGSPMLGRTLPDSQNLSIDDNFFVIGGNSLKAISVMTNLKNKGYSISVRDIIKYRTVEMIALHMKKENVHGTER